MAIRPGGAALRQMRTLLHLGTIGHLTDGQLLERFANGPVEAAEPAFAALVDRHGPMVLRVCRGILRDEHDAQDAFQATFLVLVRKGRSLWVRDSIGPWLHAVALRASRSAKAARLRRRRREGAALSAVAEPAEGPEDRSEVGPALHEEIGRLPERFRAPIILCDLQGRTHDQAAQVLGCPVGTVKSRLARARARLKGRLERRGLAPSACLGSARAASGARAAVPASLARATVEIATNTAAGALPAGAIPAAVAALAGEVSRAMIATRMTMLAAPMLAVGLAAGWGIDAQGDGPRADGGPDAAALGGAQAGPGETGGGGIPLHEVGPGAPAAFVVARGTLESSRAVEVRSRVEGAVPLRSIVPEGTRVEEGDVICELDSAALRDRLAGQRIASRRSRAEFEAAQTALGVAEIELRQYREQTYPAELEAIAGEIALAEQEVKRAEDRASWSDRMLELGYITTAQNRDDRPALERARLGLDQARQRRTDLTTFAMPKTVKALEAEVEKARAAMLAAQEASERELAEETRILEQVKRCTIVAPFGGVVIHPRRAFADAGRGAVEVREGQPLLTIADLGGPMRANVKVPEAWVDRVVPGQRARIEVDAFPGPAYEGSVIEVKPLPDPTTFFGTREKVYTALIEFDAVHRRFRPGMPAEARIRISEEDRVLRIPSRAVLGHDGNDYVAVRGEGGRFEWREVALGLRRGAMVEVERGVRAGDLVATDPIALIRRGSEPGPIDRPDADRPAP